MFFPGTAGPAGPAGPTGPQGPAGPIGDNGAVGVYVGNYVSSNTYYDNDERRDIVAYGGFFWIADNPIKNGTNTWEAPNVTDWTLFGSTLTNVATALALIGAQGFSVAITVSAPGNLQSGNYVAGSAGWLANGAGALQAFDATINGLISTNTPKFNLASLTRTMPSVGYAEFDTGAIVNASIPVNPTINNVTDNALIFFGWLQGTNAFLENRFGNASQKFQVTVQGIGTNTSAGADLFYIQLYYRTRTSGGAWGAWTVIGQDAYVQKIAGVDQSFQNIQPLSIALIGTNDIQFSAGFSKGVGGTVSVGGAKISVLAFN